LQRWIAKNSLADGRKRSKSLLAEFKAILEDATMAFGILVMVAGASGGDEGEVESGDLRPSAAEETESQDEASGFKDMLTNRWKGKGKCLMKEHNQGSSASAAASHHFGDEGESE
jgi:hypothetical protein